MCRIDTITYPDRIPGLRQKCRISINWKIAEDLYSMFTTSDTGAPLKSFPGGRRTSSRNPVWVTDTYSCQDNLNIHFWIVYRCFVTLTVKHEFIDTADGERLIPHNNQTFFYLLLSSWLWWVAHFWTFFTGLTSIYLFFNLSNITPQCSFTLHSSHFPFFMSSSRYRTRADPGT